MRWLVVLILAGAVGTAVIGWNKAGQLRAENEGLRAELETQRVVGGAALDATSGQQEQELKRLRGEAEDVLRLRGEVRLLRAGANEVEKLRAENQRLRVAVQQAPVATTGTASAPAVAAPRDQFPKESWTFSGYATPESALISAIWSMQEGNPKTYLESLSTEEQARMSKAWENKTEAEVVAKHQSDVSKITGVRVLERQEIAADEMQMNVYIEGVGRMEKVSMKRVGNDWKFGGYIRPPPK